MKLFLPANYVTGGQLAADGPQMAKTPITSQPGGITFWQDPDPQKWFDLENWASMQNVDFFISLGDNPEPVAFNGNQFSIKLGILTNVTMHSEFVGGSAANGRVYSRVGPQIL